MVSKQIHNTVQKEEVKQFQEFFHILPCLACHSFVKVVFTLEEKLPHTEIDVYLNLQVGKVSRISLRLPFDRFTRYFEEADLMK